MFALNNRPENEVAAFYYRVSSDEQREKDTIQNQREFGKNYRILHKKKLFKEYEDNGVSGTVAFEKRPGTRELLQDAKDGKFNVLYVFRIDRIARSAIKILSFVEQLEKYGVIVQSMTEPIDSVSPTGRLVLTMIAAFAQHERDTLLYRSELGMVEKAKKRHMGGAPAYGYRTTPDGQWEIDEEQAKAIREMFHFYLQPESSVYSTARELTRRGYPPPTLLEKQRKGDNYEPRKRKGIEVPVTNEWAPVTISKFLRNPAYKGLRGWRKRHLKKQDDGTVISMKADPEDVIYSSCPAIVTDEIWEAAQKKINENIKNNRRNSVRTYLLKGKIFCGHCSYGYIGHTGKHTIGRNGLQREYTQYYGGSKTTSSKTRGQCQDSMMVNGSILEEKIWEEILEFLKHPRSVITKLRDRRRADDISQEQIDKEIAVIDKELGKNKAARKRLAGLVANEVLGEDEVIEEVRKLDAGKEDLEAKKLQLQNRGSHLKNHEEQLKEIENMLDELSRSLDKINKETKARLIRLLVEKVVITTKPVPQNKKSRKSKDKDSKEKRRPYAEIFYRFDPGFDELSLGNGHSGRPG